MELLNEKKLEATVSSFGKELTLELLDRVLALSSEQLRQAAQSDLQQAEQLFHRLNSDSGWLGATALHRLADHLELKAADRDQPAVLARLDELSRTFESTRALLAQARQKLS